MLFYRNLLNAAFELAPDQTMRAVTDVVTTFQMPGTGIEGFTRKAMTIANAGIYDLRLHLDDVLMPVLRQWGVFDMTDLDADGEKAREELSDVPRPASRPPPPASSSAARPAAPARPPAPDPFLPARLSKRDRSRCGLPGRPGTGLPGDASALAVLGGPKRS